MPAFGPLQIIRSGLLSYQFLLQPIDGVLHVTTYAQAVDQARRMATALLGLGLSSGDKVALLAKNSAEWVIADLSIAMAGLISVPIYPTASANTARFFQLPAATISRAKTAANINGKARSIAMISAQGSSADTATATRPANHSATNPASGQPTTGSRPVQFGTAVSKKPAITALR